MVYFIYAYKPKKNASRTDITNYDEKSYRYVPTYGDESTGYHRHMISVVVFLYSNTLKSMMLDYTVIEMGCFDDNSDAVPRAKTMRVVKNDLMTKVYLFGMWCITWIIIKSTHLCNCAIHKHSFKFI